MANRNAAAVRRRLQFWARAVTRGAGALNSAAGWLGLVVLLLGLAAGVAVPLVLHVSRWLTAVILLAIFALVVLEGCYRLWDATDQLRASVQRERDKALEARSRAVKLSDPSLRDRLGLGDRLQPEGALHSAATLHQDQGRFTLAMQRDGNLVVEPNDGGLPWFASDTVMLNSGNHLVLREDGNRVLCTDEGVALRESLTAGHGAMYLIIQHDGNLVLQGEGPPVWATNGSGFRWTRCPALLAAYAARHCAENRNRMTRRRPNQADPLPTGLC